MEAPPPVPVPALASQQLPASLTMMMQTMGMVVAVFDVKVI